jgi:hypothetical protein
MIDGVASDRALFSSCFLDASTPQTTSADQHTFDATGCGSPHFLQIRVPSPFGLVIGMTHIIAYRRALTANCTMSHSSVFPCYRHRHVTRVDVSNLAGVGVL